MVHTSPYFHDGEVFALEDAILYHSSEEARLDPRHAPALDLLTELTEDEVDDLIAFLRSLDGEPIPQKYMTVLPDLP